VTTLRSSPHDSGRRGLLRLRRTKLLSADLTGLCWRTLPYLSRFPCAKLIWTLNWNAQELLNADSSIRRNQSARSSVCSDGTPHKISEVFRTLGRALQINRGRTERAITERDATPMAYRANWACYDLFRAGLPRSAEKGSLRITELGKKIAAQ